jgi:hypothetical protein
VPVLLPEGLQPPQGVEGWVEVLVYSVITIRRNVQEELLKLWEGGQRCQEIKELG